MLRRRMMMAQGGVSLPANYTKIEYLESDGNSYIDTGFKPNNNTRVVMDLIAAATASTTSGYLCGARESGSSKQFALQTRTEYYAARYGTQEVTIYNGVVTGRQIIDMNKNVYTVNGVSLTLTYETFSCPVSFCLFDINNNGEIPYSPISSMRLYSCQIYDNGTLVRDFIPAMNASGEAGLYDLKNDVWYALLTAVKPKVENKISIYIDRLEFNGTTLSQSYGFQSTFPVTSTISIMCRIVEYDSDGSFWLNGLYTMDSGITKTSTKETYHNVAETGTIIDSITSISPTEDDTYIYTF